MKVISVSVASIRIRSPNLNLIVRRLDQVWWDSSDVGGPVQPLDAHCWALYGMRWSGMWFDTGDRL